MENNSDLEFLLMFTNFPDIDRNSFTTKDYICNKYKFHPAEAWKWIEDAVSKGLIEEAREDSPLGKLKGKIKYKITNKGYQRYMYRYMYSEEV